jgi:hypothetical protein
MSCKLNLIKCKLLVKLFCWQTLILKVPTLSKRFTFGHVFIGIF